MNVNYVLLFLTGTVLMAISFDIRDIWSWGSDALSNIATGFYGSIIVYYLIEKRLEESHEEEIAERRRIALTRVRRPLQSLLNFLAQFYKASSNKPDPIPKTYTELFSEDYYENIRYLDFEQDAPVIPKRTWMTYSSEVVIQLKNQFDQVIDTYGLSLDPETLELLEKVSNCFILGYCTHFRAIIQVDKLKGYKRHYLMLNGYHTMVQEDLPIVLELLEKVNSVVTPSLSLTSDFGRDDISPKWGINRTNIKIT